MFRPQTRLDMFQLLISDICSLLPQTWVEIVPRSPFKISSSFTLTDAGCSHRLGNHILQKKKKISCTPWFYWQVCRMKISWQWNNKRKNKNKNKTKYPNRSARVNVSNVSFCKLRIWWNFTFLFLFCRVSCTLLIHLSGLWFKWQLKR